MQRRRFLGMAGMAGLSTACAPLRVLVREKNAMQRPKFPDADAKWKRTWDAALAALARNTKRLSTYNRPVLIEGAEYPGIWLECAPMEALVYAELEEFVPRFEDQPSPTEIARANHMAFFALQREDGQLPAYIWEKEVGYSQIQMVVPVAATAWELVQLRSEEHTSELQSRQYLVC